MELDTTGRVALISVDRALATKCGGTYEDTEGINNLPLTVKDIVAVAFFKEASTDEWRVSLRSKEFVNVNAVARQFGGGGHKNASGCTVRGTLNDLKALFTGKLTEAIESAELTN
jgi:phosphoesterase RecJ-like protein